VQKAYASNERQITLVNDLLRVAQMDAGKIVLRPALMDVAQLVRDVVAEQTDSFAARGQSVEVIAPSQLVASIDGPRLRTVVENLVDNASKYTPQGGSIFVRCNAAAGWLRLEVQDSGVGIPQAEQGKLFTKFTRLPNALSDRAGGSGLGLYWVNKIVNLHSGHVDVVSEPGEGTTFVVSVPLGAIHA
jgi:signal transduction histidine kinase